MLKLGNDWVMTHNRTVLSLNVKVLGITKETVTNTERVSYKGQPHNHIERIQFPSVDMKKHKDFTAQESSEKRNRLAKKNRLLRKLARQLERQKKDGRTEMSNRAKRTQQQIARLSRDDAESRQDGTP